MNTKDMDEFELDIQEAFLEIGDSTNIAFKRFTLGGTSNIYKESKTKGYDSPTTVTGRAQMTPKEDEITPLGRRKEVTAIFTVVSKDLKDKSLMNSSGVLSITIDDRIVFREEDYEICNIKPSSMLGDRFLIYKFECKKVV